MTQGVSEKPSEFTEGSDAGGIKLKQFGASSPKQMVKRLRGGIERVRRRSKDSGFYESQEITVAEAVSAIMMNEKKLFGDEFSINVRILEMDGSFAAIYGSRISAPRAIICSRLTGYYFPSR